ncbi:MAG: hypothetical protein GXP38_01725 [Chloroflexi bacterium]|nr:hypothetical protein [Chloroflexota bacterium]
MDRTIPTSANEDIQLYMRTYYSLLRSTSPVQIKTLIEAHKRMRSALHVDANELLPDWAALTYTLLRLPDCIHQVRLVVMGQSEDVFASNGYLDVQHWSQVSSPGRRRRSFFNGKDTLAVYIASRSDIDDLIPMLTAYQIERRKLRFLLNRPTVLAFLRELKRDEPFTPAMCAHLAALTGTASEDWQRLQNLWPGKMLEHLLELSQFEYEISVRLLSGSLADYRRATRRWWENVEQKTPDIDFESRPVYFVSSNSHSLANLLSGYPLLHEETLHKFLYDRGSEALLQEYHAILKEHVPSSRENFLYYAWKKYENAHPQAIHERIAHERSQGIRRIPSELNAFDIEVQVVSLSQINPELLDTRLRLPGIERLADSNALIVNIDYPLGMGAYQVLNEVARNIAEIRGVYIMGKAATLNGRIGDVMIPSVVHDEHSLNTYLFANRFTADDVVPYLVYGSVLDNQKAITVPGTFLQNADYMTVFYEEGYTDMEMEAGPYLSSIYEMVRPKRHPYNEIVNLYNTPFTVGILHYASDTPFSKGKNLGTKNLSYFGMDPTYATMVAILRALLQEELQRVAENHRPA